MALETLKGVEKIGGFDVIDLDKALEDVQFKDANGNFDWGKYDEYRKDFPISICHKNNSVSFQIQNGPVKEKGVNGCQVDTIIETAAIIIQELNHRFACQENAQALSHLKMALDALKSRKANREKRGVEGLDKKQEINNGWIF